MDNEEVAGVIKDLIRECRYHDLSYHYETTESVLERAFTMLGKLANERQNPVIPEKERE